MSADSPLKNGAVLLAPEQATELSTPFGRVHVSEGAVALIVCNRQGLTVYNLESLASFSF
jgi:hypothetical protein